tara:strand:- start:10 stop:363 length:354 start_codon:yes stop_codon:yes gene_type:complete
MAISYAWDVSTVDTYPTKDSKADVIYNVHWRLTATDDANNDADGNPQTANVYGGKGLDTSDLSSFTAFASVSKANVQAWVEAAFNATDSDTVANMKTGLDAQIAKKITPTSVTKTIS